MSSDRVQVLEKLYQLDQSSELLDLALEKLLTYELYASERQLHQLEQDLTEFEQKYALPSEQFHLQFQAGQMGDAIDFVEWASLFDMAERLRERIELLKGTL